MRRGKLAALALAFALAACCVGAAPFDSPYRAGEGRYPRFEAKQAEPGVHYGEIPDFPLPKTLLYSVTVDELLAESDTWIKLGYGGFFLTGIAPEWSVDIWGVDKEPWTIGESDKTLQKVRTATAACTKHDAEVFLATAFSHTFDWFSDIAWQHIEHRFRQMAIFARDSGCRGIAVDIEYIHPQYHFNWEGYTYDGYTRADIVAKMRDRMTAIAEAMYDEFPEVVLLTLPEGMFALGSQVQTAWIETAARRNAPGGVHICTEYSYRRPNIRFMFGHAWLNIQLVEQMLSPKALAYWRENGSIAAGMWPLGDDPDDFHGVAPTADEFRQAFAASLMLGSRYNWIYSHNLKPLFRGETVPDYEPVDPARQYARAISKREVVTDKRFVTVARALRNLESRDYSEALGLTTVPTFAGPREELEVGLMPADLYRANPISAIESDLWDLGFRILNGETIDLTAELGTQTDWLLAGPFENKNGNGYDAVYPPETNPDAVEWQTIRAPEGRATINLAEIIQPSEWVCAYAMCYIESPVAQEVHVRIGANDTWKLWVNGELAMACPDDGRIILDREIVPVTLKPGSNPVLLKVCNNRKDWGYVFRVTNASGEPVAGVSIQTHP